MPLPNSMADYNFEGFTPDDSALIDDVVSMGRSVGLEVERKDFH